MTEFSDVAAYIATQADAEDITRIYDLCKTRNRALRDARSAGVRVGSNVVLAEISPQYLIGLRGVVESISNKRGAKRATVTLDADSTHRLRYAGDRFFVPPDVETYDLTGVPLSSCVPAE